MIATNKLVSLLNDINCKYCLNCRLSAYTSFKIGGECPIVIKPSTVEQIQKIIRFCNDEALPFYIFGKGSNLLINDSGLDAVVIELGDEFSDVYLINDITVCCTAGISLAKVCNFAKDNSLSGLEFAYGIPGSVGGAVYMNAGAYGGEIVDVFESCEIIDSKGNIKTVTKDDAELSYRHSIFMSDNCCITSVKFKLKKGKREEIKSQMDDYMNRRKTKQPLEYPSAGSTFKRPEGNYASALIDMCGLKGKTIGGAQVSEKHCGFVINRENATYSDVISLIDYIKDEVYEKTGYKLECEVKIL